MHSGKANNIQIHAVGRPTIAEIIKTLEVCQKSPGRMVVLQWTLDGSDREYELAAIIPVVRARVGATPMPVSSIPELSLSYQMPGGNPTLIWNQTSADAKVIFHLVNREMGGASNAFQAFDDDDNNGVRPPVERRSSTSGAFSSASGAGVGAPPSASTSGAFTQPSASSTNIFAPPIDSSQTNAAVSMKLEGNLGEIDLSNLLQSIAMCKMTGCMKVFNDDVAASLFMEKGTPTHAYVVGSKAITSMGAEIEGSDALLEMLLISDGTFHFNPQQQTTDRTVPKPLQMYLLEGAALRDHWAQLVDQGFDEDAIIVRVHKNLEYAAFKSKLSEGIPASVPVQKHLYQLADGKMTLGDILRRQPLKRSEWVPALFNLMHCGLLQKKSVLSDEESTQLSAEALASSLKLAQDSLVNPSTDLMPFPLLLHYIDQEFSRYEIQELPFALAAFEVWLQTPGGAQLLSDEETKLMVERIRSVISRHDQIGLFVDGFFAILLPMQDVSAAAITAQKLLDVIGKTSFPRAGSAAAVKVVIGISSVPEICTDLSGLLRTAKESKNVCKKTGANIYTHRNLSTAK